MKLWMQYVKQRRRGILSGVLFVVIFLISFVLYRLPVKAVCYPAALCFLLGILFTILDVRRVKRRHDLLTGMRELTDILTQTLPASDGVEDEDYQAIIRMFQKEHAQVISHNQQTFSEMVDYYTVWAHQIKTPIASMRLTLQNEDTSASRKLSNDLFRIEQYVEMVLTFLRLNSKSTDYVIREYDLDAIIRQSVKKFAGEFISRKLSLIYEPLHVTVLTDEKWLSFVIEQVLSNALKYTPSGSISITMEDENRLCIRDTGIGIAAEDLPRIFEHGYTGYNGRVDKKASGIGLYLCKRICERLGHGIKAESIIDEGTCIIIDLSREYLEVE
ncbi:MAG: sensor histidine kinase [Eubacteriales bacterium]|nr:sensor histidine kinase [Eubacteriales bacterium]